MTAYQEEKRESKEDEGAKETGGQGKNGQFGKSDEKHQRPDVETNS